MLTKTQEQVKSKMEGRNKIGKQRCGPQQRATGENWNRKRYKPTNKFFRKINRAKVLNLGTLTSSKFEPEYGRPAPAWTKNANA